MPVLSLWTIVQWWGCSLAGAKTGQRDEAEGRPIFTLHYDAYEGFEEADHDVCFVDKYRLIHLEDGAEMTWKIEGQEVDRDAVLASLGDEAVDLQEVSYCFLLRDVAEGAEEIVCGGSLGSIYFALLRNSSLNNALVQYRERMLNRFGTQFVFYVLNNI